MGIVTNDITQSCQNKLDITMRPSAFKVSRVFSERLAKAGFVAITAARQWLGHTVTSKFDPKKASSS